MVGCSSSLVFLPFPAAVFFLPSLQSLSAFLCELSHSPSGTARGTRRCCPELVMFSYFIECNCAVAVTQVWCGQQCYNFGRHVRCTTTFCSSRGSVLVQGLVQGTSKRCDYKLMRLALCKQTYQKVYSPNECYPLTRSSRGTPHLPQQSGHCSKHFWICPQSRFMRKSDTLLRVTPDFCSKTALPSVITLHVHHGFE